MDVSSSWDNQFMWSLAKSRQRLRQRRGCKVIYHRDASDTAWQELLICAQSQVRKIQRLALCSLNFLIISITVQAGLARFHHPSGVALCEHPCLWPSCSAAFFRHMQPNRCRLQLPLIPSLQAGPGPCQASHAPSNSTTVPMARAKAAAAKKQQKAATKSRPFPACWAFTA